MRLKIEIDVTIKNSTHGNTVDVSDGIAISQFRPTPVRIRHQQFTTFARYFGYCCQTGRYPISSDNGNENSSVFPGINIDNDWLGVIIVPRFYSSISIGLFIPQVIDPFPLVSDLELLAGCGQYQAQTARQNETRQQHVVQSYILTFGYQMSGLRQLKVYIYRHYQATVSERLFHIQLKTFTHEETKLPDSQLTQTGSPEFFVFCFNQGHCDTCARGKITWIAGEYFKPLL